MSIARRCSEHVLVGPWQPATVGDLVRQPRASSSAAQRRFEPSRSGSYRWSRRSIRVAGRGEGKGFPIPRQGELEVRYRPRHAHRRPIREWFNGTKASPSRCAVQGRRDTRVRGTVRCLGRRAKASRCSACRSSCSCESASSSCSRCRGDALERGAARQAAGEEPGSQLPGGQRPSAARSARKTRPRFPSRIIAAPARAPAGSVRPAGTASSGRQGDDEDQLGAGHPPSSPIARRAQGAGSPDRRAKARACNGNPGAESAERKPSATASERAAIASPSAHAPVKMSGGRTDARQGAGDPSAWRHQRLSSSRGWRHRRCGCARRARSGSRL